MPRSFKLWINFPQSRTSLRALNLVDVSNDFVGEKENPKQLFGNFTANDVIEKATILSKSTPLRKVRLGSVLNRGVVKVHHLLAPSHLGLVLLRACHVRVLWHRYDHGFIAGLVCQVTACIYKMTLETCHEIVIFDQRRDPGSCASILLLQSLYIFRRPGNCFTQGLYRILDAKFKTFSRLFPKQ